MLLGSYGPSLVAFRLPLIAMLRAAGCEVCVGIPLAEVPEEDRARIRALGVRLIDIPVDRHSIGPFANLAYLLRVRRIARAEAVDCLVPYTWKPVILGGLGARLAGVRRILPLMTGLGSVFTGVAESPRARLLRRGLALSARCALAGAQTIFFQNRDDARDLAQFGGLPRGARIAYIAGSGIDTAHYAEAPIEEREALVAGRRAPRFLMLARLLAHKGVREYAEAAAMVKRAHPEVEFALAGPFDGNPSGIVPEEVASWHWLDYLGALADVRPALARCDVFVLPSYREGTPRSVLEAMATGRAIVTSDAPGCRETVIDGRNGHLVPVGEPRALCEALLRFVRSPRACVDMGAESRRLACERFRAEVALKPLLASILEGKEGPTDPKDPSGSGEQAP